MSNFPPPRGEYPHSSDGIDPVYIHPPGGLDPNYINALEKAAGLLPVEFNTEPQLDEYATSPLHVGFNLPRLLNQLKAEGRIDHGQHYGVAFRSDRLDGIPDFAGAKEDRWSHIEARIAEGYEYYGKGPILIPGQCMSFCIWLNAELARRATNNPAHKLASSLAPQLYKSAVVEFLDIDFQSDFITIADNKPPHMYDFINNKFGQAPPERSNYSRPVVILTGLQSAVVEPMRSSF